MKKFFGHGKKNKGQSRDLSAEEAAGVGQVQTPIYANHAKYLTKPSPNQQRQRQIDGQQLSAPLNPIAGPPGTPPTPGLQDGWEAVQPPNSGRVPPSAPSGDIQSPPSLVGVTPSRSSSFHSIPSPHTNANINGVGRPPSPSLTNTSSRHPGGYSPNPTDLQYARSNSNPNDQYSSAAHHPQRPPPTKKVSTPAALGILAALDPHNNTSNTALTPTPGLAKSYSEERFSENGHGQHGTPGQYAHGGQGYHLGQGQPYTSPQPPIPPEKKEKRGFWSRDREKDKERREREQTTSYQQYQQAQIHEREHARHSSEGDRTLTSMIGYLAATNSEDWSVVLEVCDRASLSEANAKEAVKALRSEFKYGQPGAQLAAAKLWAIMLRNSTDVFISQSRSRKFLDTLEEIIKSRQTLPVVTERLLEIVAAAAYASGRHKKGSEKDGFRGLWLRVKPASKPDEGIPFDSEDAMFSPPSSRTSAYENVGVPSAVGPGGMTIPVVAYQEASPVPLETLSPVRHKSQINPTPTRNRIIPPDEDIRRLFQECRMATGNANLLSEALLTATPSTLKRNEIIREFYKKCKNSQALVFAQIEWATAQAEHSRAKRDRERAERAEQREKEGKAPKEKIREGKDDETTEEKLLGALLGANEELLSALRQYDDLMRIVQEKKVEAKSRKETRMDRRELAQHQQLQQEDQPGVAAVSRSRSPSPSSRSGSPPSNGGHGQSRYTSQSPSNGGYGANAGHPPPSAATYTTQALNQGMLYANPHSNHSYASHRPLPEHDTSSLAPPPKAPYGPRSPGNVSLRSRTPSPHGNSRGDANEYHADLATALGNTRYSGSYEENIHTAGYAHQNHHTRGPSYQDDNASSVYYAQGQGPVAQDSYYQNQQTEEEFDEAGAPIRPSEKALGKRKAQEPENGEMNPRASVTSEDLYLSQQGILSLSNDADSDNQSLSSTNDHSHDASKPWFHPPVQYVYDAAAERTRQRLAEAQASLTSGTLVNGVH